MSQWTIGVRESEVLLPILFFGLGLGAIFPIVTALASDKSVVSEWASHQACSP